MKRFFLLIFFPFAATAQPGFSDTSLQIEKILQPWTHSNLPGVSIAISRNGQLLYANAVGAADLEHGIANDTATIFEAGSVSKQFTAAAILLLQQDGKLRLQDDVRTYIPELPEYGAVLTIYDLIHHQSGLRDWGSVAEVEGWGRGTRAYSNAHALQIICRQKALNNAPGTEYIYSNSNYNLMAIIVERVAKTSFAQFCKERIFQPAGMTHTSWRSDYRQIVKNRAIAYQQTPLQLKTLMPNENAHGNGGLLTTASDLVKWAAFMQAGKLGGTAFLQQQLERGRFRNGVWHPYAAGLRIDQFNGQDRVTHSGATAGYRANLDYFPKQGLAIALLSNTSGFSPVQVADKIASLFIPAPPTTASLPLQPFKAAPAVQKKLEGWYRNSKSDDADHLIAADSLLLLAGKQPFLRATDGSYSINGYRVYFTSSGFTRIDPGPSADTVLFLKEPAASWTPAQLKQFEGSYKSEEANVRIRLKATDKTLEYSLAPDAPVVYTPTYKDGFETSGSNLRFLRNQQGKLTGFTISVGRARRIAFYKE